MHSPAPDNRGFGIQALLAVGVGVIVVGLALLLFAVVDVLLLVFFGILLAVFLSGLTNFVKDRTRLPRGAALLSVILALLVVGFLTGRVAGPGVADQASRLAERIPEAVETVRTTIEEQEWAQMVMTETPDIPGMLADAGVVEQLTGIFSTAFGVVGSVLFVLFLGIYAAAQPAYYVDGAVRLLPAGRQQRGREVARYLYQALGWWLVGQFSAMAVVGTLITVGLFILNVPLAAVLGLLAGVLAFVPILGPIVSAVPAILIAAAEEPILALYVVVLFAGVQSLESYIITPLIQIKAVALPPALLLVAQVLAAVLVGVLGVILATPLAVAIIVLVQLVYVEDVLGDRVKVLGEH